METELRLAVARHWVMGMGTTAGWYRVSFWGHESVFGTRWRWGSRNIVVQNSLCLQFRRLCVAHLLLYSPLRSLNLLLTG